MHTRRAMSPWLAGGLLGAVVFWLLYGLARVNPCSDAWIYNGYIERDIIQHYAMWQYYRVDDWHRILLLADNVAFPDGATVANADAIPLLALGLKLLRGFLPETFQYFGLFTLSSFVLAGSFACALTALFTKSWPRRLMGTALFVFSPLLLERAFRHTALTAQWIILAAFYYYIVSRRREKFPLWPFLVLCGITPLIHPYFLPMLFAVLLAALAEWGLRLRRFGGAVLRLAGCMGTTLAVVFSVGVVRLGDGAGAGAEGYGSYNLNLNAFFNPTSADFLSDSGRRDWSLLLPILPQTGHQYDGFAYLGAGVLAGCVLLAVLWLLHGLRWTLRHAAARLQSHWCLGLVMLCLALFAVSHVVMWNLTTLVTIPLPDWLLQLCGIFRASGRMIWPVWYLILLVLVRALCRLPGRAGAAALGAVLCLQLADLSPQLLQKHAEFAAPVTERATEYNSEGFRWLAENYTNVCCMASFMDYELAAGFIRYNHDIQTDLLFFARGNYHDTLAHYAQTSQLLYSGEPIDENTLYLCSDLSTAQAVMEAVEERAVCYNTGHYYFICIPRQDCPLQPLETGGADS